MEDLVTAVIAEVFIHNEWRTKVSFGRTMMQALGLLGLAKRHVSERSDIEPSP